MAGTLYVAYTKQRARLDAQQLLDERKGGRGEEGWEGGRFKPKRIVPRGDNGEEGQW